MGFQRKTEKSITQLQRLTPTDISGDSHGDADPMQSACGSLQSLNFEKCMVSFTMKKLTSSRASERASDRAGQQGKELVNNVREQYLELTMK